ncbi:MAG: helix-turn-helix domain-containing protein [Spirochaetaceae bacterium]|nr:helix-turn-helix domain-containing protein [Spirochaetaceae bacterium]
MCIADDEVLIQQSITARLRTSGTPVRVLGCAENAESAIILYWSAKPDIFFVDINMPGADGLSLVRRIREEDPDCSTKFIIITGYDDFSHLREAIQSGVTDYLKKPISTGEFNAVIAAAVNRIQAERKKNFSEKREDDFYENYMAEGGQGRVLGGGTLLAAYAPSGDILNDQEKEGRGLHFFLTDSPEKKREGRFALSFQNIRNLRLYYCPGSVIPRRDLQAILLPLTTRLGMSFVYSWPQTEGLETLVERLEQSLNSRFLRPGLIECSRKVFTSSADTGRLDYAIENGQQDSCRSAVTALLSRVSAKVETIGELSTLYRQIILLFINKYVTHNISMPGPLKLELSPFALCRYQNRETLRNFLCGAASSLARTIGAEGRSGELIQGVIEYLKQNYRNNITLNDVSGHFYVTAPYLSRRFREKTGLTFVEYLEEIRLEKAEEYLTASDTKITDISEQVGYMDPNYFSKVFKRKYRLSPSDYRSAHRQ